MKFHKILLISAAVLFCAASLSATTLEHTWVSAIGSDSSNCSNDFPCLTFAGALSKTSPGGLITAWDAGDFGPVTINQSVTIDGSNLGSITFGSSSSIGITILGGANVTIQNLTINGLGLGQTGIYAGGGIVIVKNCDITNIANSGYGINYAGSGNLTVDNTHIGSFIGDSVSGIYIAGASGAVNFVVRNTFIDALPLSNTNSGVFVGHATGPVTGSLQNVTIRGAGNGALNVAQGTIQVTGSVLTQNSTAVDAFYGSTISVASSLITSNAVGVCSNTGSKIRLDNNDIYDNPTAIGNCGGIVKTSTSNKTSGTIAIPAADVSESVTF